MIKRIFSSLVLVFFSFLVADAQSARDRWVDSVMNQLSEEEKIGQLFIVPVSSNLEDNRLEKLEKDVSAGAIGGLLFTSGNPLRQVSVTNRLQSSAKAPLFIAMDANEGLGRVLDSTLAFPEPLALAAIDSDSLFFQVSDEIARELNLLGVHINLGPTANLLEKGEPFYQYNFYGDNASMVTPRLLLQQKAFRARGIISAARHYRVQGVTVTEIQDGIPSVQIFSDTLINATFTKLLVNGIGAVVPGPSQLPLFYEHKKVTKKNRFNSAMLSSFFTGNYLKRQLQYQGLIIIDIRTLQNAGKLRASDREVLAFKTGNDLIITEENPSSLVRKIKKVLKKERQYVDVLNRSVRRVIAAKYDAGLIQRPQLVTENLLAKLNTTEARVLQKRAFRESITVVRNTTQALPIRSLENKKIAMLITGDTTGTKPFTRMVGKYAHTINFYMSEPDSARVQAIVNTYDIVIAAMTPSLSAESIGKLSRWLKSIRDDQQIVVADLANPNARAFAKNFDALVSGFSNNPEIHFAMPQLIFGAIAANGMLPVSIDDLPAGLQIHTPSLKRLSYSIPEDASVSSKTLKRIESIAAEAISIQGAPGCVVFVAKDGKVIYEKAFGHYTYDGLTPVTDSTIYDLASVTKVSATLQAVMFMYDRGLIDLNKKASYYLPELKKSNKENFTLKDILTHQSGLWPFIPFYVQTMKDSEYLPGFYSNKPSPQYPYMVAKDLFTYSAMRDSLWSWAIKGKIREKPTRTPFDYRYSDLGFYILQHLSERILNQPIEDFVEQNIYEPLGAHTTGYLPLLRFPATRIAPTENDKLFRKSLLVGTVHDPGAAMHGGVAGHAGLFSTANDLGKLGQMLLQEGYYGGYQYFKPQTVRLFSQRAYESNHRGLGWAKSIQSDHNSPTSLYASPKTFGHTGYTGTCIWIDPEFDLVYIFLSNRVYPDVSTKLLSANIRSRIQDVIYQSIFDYCRGHQHREELKDENLTTAAGQ